MSKRTYYSFDGDQVGRRLQALILENDLEGIANFSRIAAAALTSLTQALERAGAHMVFSAGDSIMAWSSSELDLTSLPLRSNGIRFSVGVGDSPREALVGLTKSKIAANGEAIRYQES